MPAPRTRWLLAVLLALVATGLVTWATRGSGEDGPRPPLDAVVLGVEGRALVIRAEVADDELERLRGLSGRSFLAPDRGMLFVNEEDVDTAFTMKNTLIPLSVAFLDSDGTVLEILRMEPCADDPCPTYPPSGPYRSALEVNLGVFRASGVVPGDRISRTIALAPG